MSEIAYLSLGSNLGDRAGNLRLAVQKLGDFGEVRKVSSFYETEPVEFTDQPWFLNCAVELHTYMMPEDLLSALLGLERSMGRERVQPKGPRIIDIDILLFGNSVVKQAKLAVPHPAMHERRFVLEPLAEIAPAVRHPLRNQTAREMLLALPGNDARVNRI